MNRAATCAVRAVVAALALAGGPPAHAQPAAAAPAPDCAKDAAVQRLAPDARSVFMQRCEAGRTAPIAGTPNAPADPRDPAELCKARAVGDKMTGDARENYMRDCMRKTATGKTP